MIPHPASAIRMLAQRVLANVLPDIKSTYVLSDAAMIGMLLNGVSAEMESGIARRLADIAAIKAILQKDEKVDPALLSLVPASLTMTDVNALHDELTRALIALHDSVDVATPSPAQASLNREIWEYLHETADRHKLNLP